VLANVAVVMCGGDALVRQSRAYEQVAFYLELFSAVFFSVEYLARVWSCVEDPRFSGKHVRYFVRSNRERLQHATGIRGGEESAGKRSLAAVVRVVSEHSAPASVESGEATSNRKHPFRRMESVSEMRDAPLKLKARRKATCWSRHIRGRLIFMLQPLSMLDLVVLAPFFADLSSSDDQLQGGTAFQLLRVIRLTAIYARLERRSHALKRLRLVLSSKRSELVREIPFDRMR